MGLQFITTFGVLMAIYNLKVLSISSFKTTARCGEVLTNGGTLQYKAFEPVLPNERCVWILAVPKALGYTIDILQLGSQTNQPETLQKLIITGISYNHGYPDVPTSQERMYPPLLTSIAPTETGTITFNKTNLMLITFASDVGEGNGFALQFEEVLTGDGQAISLNTTHHIIEDPALDFIYPTHGGQYDDYELAAFVFIPHNNTFSINKPLLSFKGSAIDTKGGIDAVYIYNFRFESSYSNVWNYVAKGVAGINRLETANTDLSLALLKSNESGVGPAFRFHYVGCTH